MTHTTHDTHQVSSNHLVPEYGQPGGLAFVPTDNRGGGCMCVRLHPCACALPEISSGTRYIHTAGLSQLTHPSRHRPFLKQNERLTAMSSSFRAASSLEEYDKLLKSGADPNELQDGDPAGTTAVFWCCELGSSDRVQHYRDVLQLLLAYGADLNRTDAYGRTALYRSPSDAFSVAMLESGASMSVANSPDNFSTKSVLVSSARKGHMRAIAYMLDEVGVRVSELLGRGNVLHHLLYNPLVQDTDVTEGLAALAKHSSARVDSRDFLGRTPLYLAYEIEEHAETLLEHGADPALKIPRGWWFHREIFESSLDTNERRLESLMEGRSWELALHGVQYRSLGVTRALLERGADIDAVDSDGNTAMMRVMQKCSVTLHDLEVFQLLLSFGASCTATNLLGQTALDMPLAKHPLVHEGVVGRVKDQNWAKRRVVFLVLARCSASAPCDEKGLDSGCGALKMMATTGFGSSSGLVRTIVGYI